MIKLLNAGLSDGAKGVEDMKMPTSFQDITTQKNFLLRVILVVITAIITVQLWFYNPCRMSRGKDLMTCRAENGMLVSEITQIFIRVVLIVIICLQLLSMGKIPIIPLMGTIAVSAAAIGYVFMHQLHDFISGMLLMLSGNVEIGDSVVLDVAFVGKPSLSVVIQNFRPLYLEVVYQDKAENAVSMFVYYSKILQIQKL